jgi:hypothetical protein
MDGKVMVTVLVEKRGFGEKSGSATRPRGNLKPAAEPAAAHPPADAGTSSQSEKLSPSDRFRQISVFAYYKAEQRGFAPGHMWDDWLAAEREVDIGSVKAQDPARSGG